MPVAPAPKPAPVPVTVAEKAAAKAQAATKDARKKRKRENDGAAAESPERLARTLFIGNVPVGTKAKVIKQLCCKAAGHDEASNTRCPVESVRFRSAPIAGMAVTPGSDYKDMRKVATHSLPFMPRMGPKQKKGRRAKGKPDMIVLLVLLNRPASSRASLMRASKRSMPTPCSALQRQQKRASR